MYLCEFLAESKWYFVVDMARVVIADDEEFVRDFLKSLSESMGFKVVAEVESGDKLPDAMIKHWPDILLLDVNMPNLSGIEFLKKYPKKFPNTCIIMLTSIALSELLQEQSLADVSCFIRKGTPTIEIMEAIKQTWSAFASGIKTLQD